MTDTARRLEAIQQRAEQQVALCECRNHRQMSCFACCLASDASWLVSQVASLTAQVAELRESDLHRDHGAITAALAQVREERDALKAAYDIASQNAARNYQSYERDVVILTNRATAAEQRLRTLEAENETLKAKLGPQPELPKLAHMRPDGSCSHCHEYHCSCPRLAAEVPRG